MGNSEKVRVEYITRLLPSLRASQLDIIYNIVYQLQEPFLKLSVNEGSDLVSECFSLDFGDILRIHHSLSSEGFTKDKFEFAMQKVAMRCGNKAKLATGGNPGYDILINNERFSLKTQADKSIKEDRLHISKFIELGKGNWGDSLEDLIGLRTQFISHLNQYDRILSLRKLKTESNIGKYGLVEIPKSLLEESVHGKLSIRSKSRQNPKPGYCEVVDTNNADQTCKYQLYFDGGIERKLQIKNLQKYTVKFMPFGNLK